MLKVVNIFTGLTITTSASGKYYLSSLGEPYLHHFWKKFRNRSHISMIQGFGKIINGFLPIFAKKSVIDVYANAFDWCTDTFLFSKYYNIRQKMEIRYVSVIGLILSAVFKPQLTDILRWAILTFALFSKVNFC